MFFQIDLPCCHRIASSLIVTSRLDIIAESSHLWEPGWLDSLFSWHQEPLFPQIASSGKCSSCSTQQPFCSLGAFLETLSLVLCWHFWSLLLSAAWFPFSTSMKTFIRMLALLECMADVRPMVTSNSGIGSQGCRFEPCRVQCQCNQWLRCDFYA